MSVLGTLPAAGRDGRLVVVSDDRERHLPGPVETLQRAIESWEELAPGLRELDAELAAGGGEPLPTERLLAPFPRAVQYCEGSTYLSHMERCRAARGAALPPGHGEEPAVLQGGSDRFLGPAEPIGLADPAWGLDLEATVAVVVDDVPRGVTEAEAAGHVKLLMLTNDLTLRNVLPLEFAKGIGFFQAKPLRPFAPFAVSVDSLGDHWRDGLLHATVKSWVRGRQLGAVLSGVDCYFNFPRLIAHAALTRPLAAGTVIGSGTISNHDDRNGFGCLAEQRAVETMAGEALTPYLQPGDSVKVEAFTEDGASLFGAMDALVVAD